MESLPFIDEEKSTPHKISDLRIRYYGQNPYPIVKIFTKRLLASEYKRKIGVIKMKKIFGVFALLLFFLAPVSHSFAIEPTDASEKALQVKVMSYNIHHAVGEDNVLDLERIAKVIEDSGAEIIGLQEVDNHWSERSNFEDQAKWLADRLGMHYTYAANLDRDPLSLGNLAANMEQPF